MPNPTSLEELADGPVSGCTTLAGTADLYVNR